MQSGLISPALACITFLLLFWLNRRLISFKEKGVALAIPYVEMWCIALQPGVLVGVGWFLYSFATTQSSLMLNSGTYLDASALLFVLFELIALYFAKYSKQREGVPRLKFLFYSMIISFSGEAVILSEAPRLIWPMTSAKMLDMTIPILMGFGAVNFIFSSLLYLEYRKIRTPEDDESSSEF